MTLHGFQSAQLILGFKSAKQNKGEAAENSSWSFPFHLNTFLLKVKLALILEAV